MLLLGQHQELLLRLRLGLGLGLRLACLRYTLPLPLFLPLSLPLLLLLLMVGGELVVGLGGTGEVKGMLEGVEGSPKRGGRA